MWEVLADGWAYFLGLIFVAFLYMFCLRIDGVLVVSLQSNCIF